MLPFLTLHTCAGGGTLAHWSWRGEEGWIAAETPWEVLRILSARINVPVEDTHAACVGLEGDDVRNLDGAPERTELPRGAAEGAAGGRADLAEPSGRGPSAHEPSRCRRRVLAWDLGGDNPLGVHLSDLARKLNMPTTIPCDEAPS